MSFYILCYLILSTIQMANNVQRKDDEYLRMQREASEELADVRQSIHFIFISVLINFMFF